MQVMRAMQILLILFCSSAIVLETIRPSYAKKIHFYGFFCFCPFDMYICLVNQPHYVIIAN